MFRERERWLLHWKVAPGLSESSSSLGLRAAAVAVVARKVRAENGMSAKREVFEYGLSLSMEVEMLALAVRMFDENAIDAE